MCFTFDFIDNSYPETFVEFYCYEFASASMPENNIACGSNSLISRLTSVHEHSYSDWLVEKEVTCTENGNKYKICSTCDKKINEEIIASGHNYLDGVCNSCGGNTSFKYSIENDVVTIINYVGTDVDVVIPSKIEGFPVTNIGDNAFKNSTNLVSIAISDSVTSIGDSAFYGCTNLSTVTIPDSVTNIGVKIFSGCKSLKKIYWNAKNVADFTWTSSIFPPALFESGFELIFGDSVERIPAYLCCYAIGSEYPVAVTSITIGRNVTSIGEYAFAFCRNVTSVYINDVAAWCNIDFSDNFSNPLCYADNLYINGELATDITIPDNIIRIGSSAFSDCKSLTSITIADGVKNIGSNAFYNCTNLKSVVIGNGIVYIGDSVFSSCNNLKYIFYRGTSEEWGNINIGSDNANLKKAKIHYQSSDHTVSDWIIDKEASVYSSGEKHKGCTQCDLVFETETIPQLKCSKAKLSKISNTSSGVKITWGKVEGADSYRVYRKTSKTDWDYIGSTSKTDYIDKTAKSGTTYYYAVKVRNEAGNTDLSNLLSIKRLSNPKLSAVSNTSSGVKVSWKKVTGASGYIVYRKTKSGDWKEIGKTTNLYYTDKKAKSGTSYYYSVRAYSGSVKSYYDTTGLSIRRLVAPKISSATSKSEGILVKWNKITGASGYYVYRKASSGEWKKIATVKGNTKIQYLDETPRKGATYQYRVKAYYSKSTSYNSNSYKIKCKY